MKMDCKRTSLHLAKTIKEDARRPGAVRKFTKQMSIKPRNESEFAGNAALITGGTTGIGAATARRLADLGARVIITGRRCLEGRRLVREIEQSGGRAAFLRTD